MSKKSFIVRLVIFAVLLALLVPALSLRLKNEKQNDEVVIALNYNDAQMLLSDAELDNALKESVKIGAKTVIITEETLNSLTSSGFVTAIKYNVLCHKYDDESEAIIKQLSGDDRIHNDSYVIITKRDEAKAYLAKWIPAKFSADEYRKVSTDLNADVYVLYEGVGEAWQMKVGFDEEKIKKAVEYGLRPALSMELGIYSEDGYISELKSICDKYDVKHINLKPNFKDTDADAGAEKTYRAFCELIESNELYLVLTEDPSQLSNLNPIGYKELIKSADGRVVRNYDLQDYDLENSGQTDGEDYYSQMINSVTDRNIRFVTVKHLTNGISSLNVKSQITLASVKKVIDKLESMGYDTEKSSAEHSMKYDYTANRKFVSAIVVLLIILMLVTIIEWLSGKNMPKMQIAGIVCAVLGVAFTYLIAPESILTLYPTAYAVVAPCFCITAVMVYVKKVYKTMKPALFAASTILIAIALMLITASVQAALLSGMDYYLNVLIFRGIKLSLIIPVAFSCVAFGILFFKEKFNIFEKGNLKKLLTADIKVYWVILAGIVFAVAYMYIKRSGNVNTISGAEAFMRNTITELMEARPRTKEFLVGWPAFMLFLYYIRNTDCKFLQWCFAAAGSILFASVMNSFCHVFTGMGTIYMRVANGIIIGAIVSAVALIINHIIVCMVKKHLKKGQ